MSRLIRSARNRRTELTIELIAPDLERIIAEETLKRIQERTGQGLDARGKPFVPYKPGYARKRSIAGLGTRVNLKVTGSLLSSLKILRASRGKIRIGWRGTSSRRMSLTSSGRRPAGGTESHERIAHDLHTGQGSRAGPRRFLGLETPAEKSMVARRVEARIKALRKRRR